MASILGVKVDNITRQQAIERVGLLLLGSGQHLITTPNPEFIVAAQKDEEFREILNQASLALPDGVGLLFAGCVLGVPLKERIAGSDFVWDIARLAAGGGYSMQLIGAGQGIAQKAGEQLQKKIPRLKIVTSQPDILLVALGHRKQEKWIAAHLPEMPSVKIVMGVGGVFDFLAGRVRRAPVVMRALGLEWFWRLFLEPRRLPRIFRAVVVFPILVIRKRLLFSHHKT